MQVQIVTSARRKKTVQAKLVDGMLRIAMPAHLSPAEQQHWVEVMRDRFQRRTDAARIDLTARAKALAGRFDLQTPGSISWSERQNTRWGSCTPEARTVRISTRVAAYPEWVIDYVIVHELAHLDVAAHNGEFWRIVDRYPMAERARGYLIAKSDGLGTEPSDS